VRSAALNKQCVRLILAALFPALAGCGAAGHRILEEKFEQTYSIEPTATVAIKNGDGAVFVYGSNVNEMRVEAIKRAYTRDRLKQIKINVSAQPDSVSIETNFPGKPRWSFSDRSGTVDYTIVIPASVNLSRIDLANGEISVEGMRGPTVRTRLERGQIFARNCFSSIELTMGSGTLTLAYDWWEPGRFSIQANVERGNAWAFLPSDAVCHLVAETNDGKVASDFGQTEERGTNEVAKIDTLINGGGESAITIRANEGNIKIVEASP